ncbi:ribonuclease HI [Desulfopila sp. IMCC35006]|uniref:ribonuclease HI n=1 Tax=Desulfopila sp. IMCC35006 TaxID=2569542 RepID=UPI0010ABC3D9|nr:ribonuclease HI [Desulfopila sp. IMCC35006]TKB24464.1 ribonuclease HI [Desulfopila sp. IMCC35006]
MAGKKYYAVAVGRSTGIYTDWATAEKQVKGFAAAKFKSFPTRAEAEAWLANPVYQKKERPGESRQEPYAKPAPQPCDPEAIIVYTDGGSINNPGPGGYGVVIETDGTRRELSGGFRHTTNNRMEMMAAIVALRELRRCGKKIILFSDSSYLVNGIKKGWAKKWRTRGWQKSDGQPVLNIDLWRELLDLLEGVDVSFNWVKGHAGNELNERCDRLAVAAARQSDMVTDVVYEAAMAS